MVVSSHNIISARNFLQHCGKIIRTHSRKIKFEFKSFFDSFESLLCNANVEHKAEGVKKTSKGGGSFKQGGKPTTKSLYVLMS